MWRNNLRMSPDPTAGGGDPVAGRMPPANSPDRTGDPDDRHRGPATSGDAANVGFRNNPDTAGGRPGGGTLRGNPGDAGADAGEGSIDATDDTAVTGDPARSAAARGEDRGAIGSTGPGDIEGAGQDTGYRQGGASGALGPEDVDRDAGAPEPVYRPSPVGPAADGDVKGYRPKFHGDSPTGTGGAEPPPGGGGAAGAAGVTNVRGPADEERERESPAGR